jgi:hypothetical protein
MKIHVEVFIASRLLEHMQGTFSPTDILDFIRKEFKDERNGVPTHVAAACVANSPLNHPIAHNYLWRVSQGMYRTFRPGYDPLKPEKKSARTQPDRVDVPEKYRYLLRQE